MSNYNTSNIPFSNNGYIMQMIIRGTGSNNYLSTVLASRNNEYVVWTFNHESGGFHHGYYTSDYEDAKDAFLSTIGIYKKTPQA